MSTTPTTPGRRPLTTRDAGWAKALASRLARARVRPNAISVASILVAIVGGAAFLCLPRAAGGERIACLAVAAACIQLRLLCNMLDGMVAVEGGLRSKTGEVYNELPDRFADLALLVPAGCAVGGTWGPTLGWACGALALLTAYVRALGVTAGAKSDFSGPMAKPHRMAALTAGCLLSIVELGFDLRPRALEITLIVIAAGAVVTVVRRTAHVLAELESR
jgi:phosphatidylglycerophosphate synthase